MLFADVAAPESIKTRLTDIAGILVGHASDYDGLTGCTVELCESGAVAWGSFRRSRVLGW